MVTCVHAKELILISSDHNTFVQVFCESFRPSLPNSRRACKRPCWPDFNPILVHYIFSTNNCHFLIKVLADGLVAYSRLMEVCFCPWFPLKASWFCPWCWRGANVRHWFCRNASFIYITTEDQKYLYMIVWVIDLLEPCQNLGSHRLQILISLDDM